MDPHQASTARFLYEWEKILAPLLLDIRLLGELPLGTAERIELAEQIRALIGRTGITMATRLLGERYPCSYLVYLAFTASRNEARGFWKLVAQEVGVRDEGAFFHPAHHWGCLFRDLLPRFGLETFPKVQTENKYVTLIRLHGGIPAYSLPDFFENVLLPAAQKPQYTGMDVPELIEQVLQRPAVQYFVDSPVRYFLKCGGTTAQDFFGRCLEMARAWKQQGDLPSAKELGLPRYVVRAFQEFMEGRLKTPKGKRLRSPRLYLTPYDPDSPFRLELPQEPVDAGQTGWRHEWCIAALTGQEVSATWSVPVRVRRDGSGFVTSEAEQWLEVPPSRLRVEFGVQDDGNTLKALGHWFFDLAPSPGEPPILAFRSGDGRFVRGNSALPRDILWLLTPAHLEVQAPSRGRLVTEAQYLCDTWADWKVEEWDLTAARSVHLVNPESGRVHHSIPVQAGQTEPYLRGKKLAQVRNQGKAPFFVEKPPGLWLPRLTGQAPVEEMRHWRIQIRSEGDADPAPPGREATLTELAAGNVYQMEDEGFLLPLSTLLGDRAAGAYTVTAKGPRRFHSELPFRIWPELSIEGLAPYHLPAPDGPTPVVFHVQIDPIHCLVPSRETAGLKVTATETPGHFQVTVQPDVTVAELTLIQPGKTDVRLPLELSVPRLRWSVRLDKETLDWTSKPLEMPVDKLLQSRHSYLILVWEGAEQAPGGRLLLRDVGNSAKPVLQEAELIIPLRSNRASLDLGVFRDTLTAKKDLSNFDLALAVEDTEDAAAVPLLHLHRELGVSCVLLEWTDRGSVVLHWKASHRLRNRRVRLWSAWRPWDPPREYLIPDTVIPEGSQDPPGSDVFSLPVYLKRGAYYVAFRTAPEWEPLYAPPFPTEDRLLVEYEKVDSRQRLKAIERQREGGKISPFLAAFERAAIFHLLEDWFLRDREIKAMVEHLPTADLNDVARLHAWLQTLASNRVAELRVHMYRPKQLERLFQGDLPPEAIDAYMAGFTETEIIEPASAELVLKHTRNPEWQAHATAILVKQTDTSDIQTIVERIRQQVFSETVGLDLLAENPGKALITLYHMPSEPLRDSLLRTLALRTQSPKVVRPGIWVRSEAGWGQLMAITVDGESRPYLLLGEEGQPLEPAVLRVELPRIKEILEANIDLGHRVIRVKGAEQVFRCVKEGCPGFAALNEEEVREDHCKIAHKGLSPAFRPSPPEWGYKKQPVFTWDAQHYYG